MISFSLSFVSRLLAVDWKAIVCPQDLTPKPISIAKLIVHVLIASVGVVRQICFYREGRERDREKVSRSVKRANDREHVCNRA